MIRRGEAGLHGVPVLWLENAHCRAALSLHGGQLLSFAPHGETDWLWLSPATRRPPGAVRGGVPVCWPYFGREGQPAHAPQHGFARTATWSLEDVREEGDDLVVELSLPANDASPLRLRQTLRLGRALHQSLATTNAGEHAVAFTQALHSYFRVGDALRATLRGVDGLQYADRYAAGAEYLQSGDWNLDDPRDPGHSDRTYRDAGDAFVLEDPALGRRLCIRSAGSRSLVVWNPGEAGVTALGDVPASEWRGFVCVEVANAGADAVVLAPGAGHVLAQTVAAALLG